MSLLETNRIAVFKITLITLHGNKLKQIYIYVPTLYVEKYQRRFNARSLMSIHYDRDRSREMYTPSCSNLIHVYHKGILSIPVSPSYCRKIFEAITRYHVNMSTICIKYDSILIINYVIIIPFFSISTK